MVSRMMYQSLEDYSPPEMEVNLNLYFVEIIFQSQSNLPLLFLKYNTHDKILGEVSLFR